MAKCRSFSNVETVSKFHPLSLALQKIDWAKNTIIRTVLRQWRLVETEGDKSTIPKKNSVHAA